MNADKGLSFLAGIYGFSVVSSGEITTERVRPYRVQNDYFIGPAGHNLSPRARILWLDGNDTYVWSWLHEVAHLVCAPPWEKSPDYADEFGGIFAWERAIGFELTRRGYWCLEDFENLLHDQEAYGLGSIPDEWNGVSSWGSLPGSKQRTLMKFFRKTLQLASLLDDNGTPIFGATPNWSEKIRERWEATSDFRTNWDRIKTAYDDCF